MGASILLASMKTCSLITALIMLTVAESRGLQPMKETKISVFMQDFYGGPNATDVMVAGIPGKEWGYLKFGTVVVSDIGLTQGIQLHSKQVGRSQGTFTTCSVDGASVQAQISIVFTNKKDFYFGATLVLQGLYNQLAVTEIPIVSGTGVFRFARGYAIFKTLSVDTSITYALTGCNITVQHY